MADRRKLQGEIDRCLKKVGEGVETFEEIWDKVHNATNANQKEKYESDLKKEIKKLQRLRDQIKTWLASSEIKDKRALTENRKLIETQMERFKIVERETKTKAYSKEGLGAVQKMDPIQKEKDEVLNWLSNSIDTLSVQVDQFESEAEALQVGQKKNKKDRDKQGKQELIKKKLEMHRYHINQLETVMRMLNNETVTVDQVKGIKDDIEYYIESYQDEDFHDNEFIYADLDIDAFRANNVVDAMNPLAKSSSTSSNSKPDSMSNIGGLSIDNDDAGVMLHSNSSSPSVESPSASPGLVLHSQSSRSAPTTTPTTTSTSEFTFNLNAATSSAASTVVSSLLNKTVWSSSGSTASSMRLASGSSAPSANAFASPSNNVAANRTVPLAPYAAAAAASHREESDTRTMLGASLSQESSVTPSSSSNRSLTTPPTTSATLYSAAASAAVTTSSMSMGPDHQMMVTNRQLSNTTPSSMESQAQLHLQRQSNSQMYNGFKGDDVPTLKAQAQQVLTPAGDVADNKILEHLMNLNMNNSNSAAVNNTAGLPDRSQVLENNNSAQALLQHAEQLGSMFKANNSHLVSSNPPPLSVSPKSVNSLMTPTPQQMGVNSSNSNISSAAEMSPVGASATPNATHHGGAQQQQQQHIPPPQANYAKNNYSKLYLHMQLLENASRQPILPMDSHRIRHLSKVTSQLSHQPPAHYSNCYLPQMDNIDYYQRLPPEILFFMFYYMEGTKAQYMAAKTLKNKSWRFHTKFMMWFQRLEEPKHISEEYEQGSYIYFDIERWSQKKREGFVFEYKYLEDKDLN